jgi:transcription antitermination factor NusA-like protein
VVHGYRLDVGVKVDREVSRLAIRKRGNLVSKIRRLGELHHSVFDV